VRFFETWKQKILFQLFVIIFDETANNSGRVRQRFRWKILLRVHPAKHFAIDQQHALQHSMLAHQVFGRRDFLLLFLWLGSDCKGQTGNG